MLKTISAGAAIAAAMLVTAFAPSPFDYDGPARWESTTVTISPDLADAAAQWGDALTSVTVEEGAQIHAAPATTTDEGVGGEAHSTFTGGNYIQSCEVAVDADVTDAVLTHEVGHCLGLAHQSTGGPTNMHWWAADYQGGWSDNVTNADLARLAELYEGN